MTCFNLAVITGTTASWREVPLVPKRGTAPYVRSIYTLVFLFACHTGVTPRARLGAKNARQRLRFTTV